MAVTKFSLSENMNLAYLENNVYLKRVNVNVSWKSDTLST